jgi:uncharacterized protein (DUF488 family)
VEVYTIGFGKHSAAQFFEALKQAGIRSLLDVRLNNVSQLAGFTKRDDLKYFLRELVGIGYSHELQLAPTAELLSSYRGGRITWDEYARSFNALMKERRVEQQFGPASFAVNTALLCSEPTAVRCHRRLVLEYLQETSIPELKPVHL